MKTKLTKKQQKVQKMWEQLEHLTLQRDHHFEKYRKYAVEVTTQMQKCFKAETGHKYGDTFYIGENQYQIVDNSTVKKISGKQRNVKLKAPYLLRYLMQKNGMQDCTPFTSGVRSTPTWKD